MISIMNDLQKTEFQLLELFVNICNKENLHYFLVCGSALGAVKYNGFIPWDDDIDVALPRKDYEIFLTEAPKYLPEWCYLQNYRTDREFHLLGSKLRDSRTTYIERMTESLNINHGVFIDVFPLDGLYTDKTLFEKQKKEFEAARRVRLKYNRFSRENVFDFKNNFYRMMYLLFSCYRDTSVYIERFDHLLATYNSVTSGYLCNYANSVSETEYAAAEQYGQGREATFEGLSVRIPEDYDAYLTQKYGDWRADLPESEKKGHHYYTVCDLNRPYIDYINK